MSKIDVERIVSEPHLSGVQVANPKFSSDSRSLAYLRANPHTPLDFELWVYDVQTNSPSVAVDKKALGQMGELSEEERYRRERMRIQHTGVTDFFWGKDSKTLFLPMGQELLRCSLDDREKPALGRVNIKLDGQQSMTDVQRSPCGGLLAFVCEQNLYMHDLTTDTTTRLTSDGGGPIKNGMAEFVAQEEMGRMTGYWWAPDSKAIAFVQVDETPVAIEKRIEVHADKIVVVEQPYPKAGEANVKYKLGFIDLGGRSGDITWRECEEFGDSYFCRGKWVDADTFSYQIENREQTQLDLRFYKLSDASDRSILTEENKTWINLHQDLHFDAKSKRFLWASERSGFKHLYLYDFDGTLISPITGSDLWGVTSVKHTDFTKGVVYFTANKDNPRDFSVYSADLEKGADATIKPVLADPGMHQPVFSPDGALVADVFSSRQQPGQLMITAIEDRTTKPIEANRIDDHHPFAPFKNQFTQALEGLVQSADGDELCYRLLRPQAGGLVPVITYVYGGPHAQLITNQWSVDQRELWAQYMVQRGFAVLTIDGRGSANRGLAFEAKIKHRMGQLEVEDQLHGLRALQDEHSLDPARCGVFGWSYGGYMTLRMMLLHPDVYKVGVSVAPVTDWSLYDTHYTERYMGTPSANEVGYREGGCLHLADQLQGKLLLVHGMADDNVLYSHSVQMYKALQEAGKNFDIMAYPGAKHGIYGKSNRRHFFNMMTDYFEQWL